MRGQNSGFERRNQTPITAHGKGICCTTKRLFKQYCLKSFICIQGCSSFFHKNTLVKMKACLCSEQAVCLHYLTEFI